MLQERISLWARWVAVLSSGFYLVNLIAFPWSGMHVTLTHMLTERGSVLHLAASLTFAAVWLLTQRVQLTLRTLRAPDLGALIGGCGIVRVDGSRARAHAGRVWWRQHDGTGSRTPRPHERCECSCHRRAEYGAADLLGDTAAFAPLVVATWATTGALAETINTASWSGVSIAIATGRLARDLWPRTEAALVRQLGQYTLEEKIGEGGMGIVYRARTRCSGGQRR